MYRFNDSQCPIVCFIDTRKMCTDTEQRLESQVTVKSQNELARIIILHIQTNHEVISNGYAHHKLAGKLCICFSCFHTFMMVSWGRLCNSCDMCKLFKFSAHFSCVIEIKDWLLTAIEVMYWSNIISKFRTFSCT